MVGRRGLLPNLPLAQKQLVQLWHSLEIKCHKAAAPSEVTARRTSAHGQTLDRESARACTDPNTGAGAAGRENDSRRGRAQNYTEFLCVIKSCFFCFINSILLRLRSKADPDL